jgi:hypothetical protein
MQTSAELLSKVPPETTDHTSLTIDDEYGQLYSFMHKDRVCRQCEVSSLSYAQEWGENTGGQYGQAAAHQWLDQEFLMSQ